MTADTEREQPELTLVQYLQDIHTVFKCKCDGNAAIHVSVFPLIYFNWLPWFCVLFCFDLFWYYALVCLFFLSVSCEFLPLWVFPLHYLTCPFPLLTHLTCSRSPSLVCLCIQSVFSLQSLSVRSLIRQPLVVSFVMFCSSVPPVSPVWCVYYLGVWFSLLICTLFLSALCLVLVFNCCQREWAITMLH